MSAAGHVGGAQPPATSSVDLALFGIAIAARGRPGRTGAEEAAWTMLHLGEADDEPGRARAVGLLAALRRDGLPARLRLVGPIPPVQRGRLLTRATAGGVVGALDLPGEHAPHEVARLLVEAALLVVPSPARVIAAEGGATAEGGAGADGGAAVEGGAGAQGGSGEASDLVPAVLAGCAAGTPVLAADLPAVRAVAAVLPGVTLLPLGAPDDAWARAAARPLPVPPTPDERWAALRRLRRSPFCAQRPTLAGESG
ncbi:MULTISPECIES: hypothetical protein [unclassified Pseudofrankia]|uniref:hypothetical protein n=1 Tax=unclassified Pseudofrankia TaxID=2994372 RepID=UPI0008D8D91A|nr:MULTISPECIES: hypothetical protein [unclassified Pseudofrankia]MDT3446480.1 glycosyltransferase family 1 protein [Pseudofrankia sp. BMG5.37]OHV45170.1 hypothetical protein BCD48_23720 [Pseudofrankia sp. BMG5.36]